MKADFTYHHGDLRAALLTAAAAEIERIGYENCRSASLRNCSACRELRRIGISPTGARCLRPLPPMALTAYGDPPQSDRERENAAGPARRGRPRLLTFAAERPQMFRLMFVSDLLGGTSCRPTRR